MASHYKRAETKTLAAILKRSKSAIWGRSQRVGVAGRRSPDFAEEIKRKHAIGWTDARIAEAIGRERHEVSRTRRKLGLPDNHQRSEWSLNQIRRRTNQQLKKAGVNSLAELKSKVFHDRAREAGWPDNLGFREVQILNLLWEKGPQSRRQICEGIGANWIGSRMSMKSRTPGGSYLATLIRLGLVVRIRKGFRILGQGKGRTCDLYSLPLFITRNTESA